MSTIIDGLVNSFRKNLDYGERLLSDLTAEQMLLQPPGTRDRPVNHAAWSFSHLNVYLPVIEAVAKGVSFEDPKGHRFGMHSSPESDAGVYPDKEEILATWRHGHVSVCDLLEQADDGIFDQEIRLPRWAAMMPNAGICLPYLMLNHENMHLGQVSAWRRALGLPGV